MEAAEADRLVRQWFDEYGYIVQRTLKSCGIWVKADQEEIALDVFLTAFLALQRDVVIENPGAWLRECARKHASSSRQKQRRRALLRETEVFIHGVVNDVLTPEQIVGDREMVGIAFDSLPESLQEIVLALRLDGSSWEEIAREKGITINQAKYLYDVAVEKMEAALQRANAKRTKRRFLAFPILLAQFFDALRSDVDGVSPELHRRVREGLDHLLESAGSGETEPESERVSFACPTPSIPITASPAWPLTARPVLGLLRGGVAVAIVIGYLLQGAPLDEPLPEPRRAQSIPALAVIEPAEPNRDAGANAPPLSTNGSRKISGELLPEDTQGARSSSAADLWKGASSSESRQLIDLARVASRTGDARAALALLAQHARSFPGKDAKDRRKVWQLVCAASAARGATECVNPPPSSAPR
jgi:DNA-directed RNA polymerase specialized sigma24 family protein